jgi:hypothetical protein
MAYNAVMQTHADEDDDADPFGPPAAGSSVRAPPKEAVPDSYRIADLAAAGLTDQEIARVLGMSVDDVAASADVLVPLGEAHDARVARAIYQSAVGGKRVHQVLDKFGDKQTLAEDVAPNTHAASFYLERRQAGTWGTQPKVALQVVVVRGVAPMLGEQTLGHLTSAEKATALDIEHLPGEDGGA